MTPPPKPPKNKKGQGAKLEPINMEEVSKIPDRGRIVGTSMSNQANTTVSVNDESKNLSNILTTEDEGQLRTEISENTQTSPQKLRSTNQSMFTPESYILTNKNTRILEKQQQQRTPRQFAKRNLDNPSKNTSMVGYFNKKGKQYVHKDRYNNLRNSGMHSSKYSNFMGFSHDKCKRENGCNSSVSPIRQSAHTSKVNLMEASVIEKSKKRVKSAPSSAVRLQILDLEGNPERVKLKNVIVDNTNNNNKEQNKTTARKVQFNLDTNPKPFLKTLGPLKKTPPPQTSVILSGQQQQQGTIGKVSKLVEGQRKFSQDSSRNSQNNNNTLLSNRNQTSFRAAQNVQMHDEFGRLKSSVTPTKQRTTPRYSEKQSITEYSPSFMEDSFMKNMSKEEKVNFIEKRMKTSSKYIETNTEKPKLELMASNHNFYWRTVRNNVLDPIKKDRLKELERFKRLEKVPSNRSTNPTLQRIKTNRAKSFDPNSTAKSPFKA